MKRFLTFFFAVAITLATFAQNNHMKFMGIPLTGSINSFQTKLTAKGIKVHSKLNSSIPVGVRAFKGDFAGYSSTIYVYYDKTSKIVYRAKVCIEKTDKSLLERAYNDLKDMLEAKYSDSYFEEGEHEGHESLSISNWLGWISIYTSTYTDYYPTTYTIHVDYEDRSNSNKNLNSKMSDI